MLKAMYNSVMIMVLATLLSACANKEADKAPPECKCKCPPPPKEVLGLKEAEPPIPHMFNEFASKLTPDKRPVLLSYGGLNPVDLGKWGTINDYWIMVAESEKPDYYIVIPWRLVDHGLYKPTKVKAGQKKSISELLKQAGLPQNEKQGLYVKWVNQAFFSQ